MNSIKESAARLHSLYAETGGVTSVFTNKVAHYVASRPDYPAALIDHLRASGVMPERARVADLGSGTGLLTRSLLDRGCQVYAVEPNREMRCAAEEALGSLPGFISVDGSAEATTIADRSVDTVTAAQSFHWFDIERAREEILRILTPTGQVALIWNDRVLEDPLHQAFDDLFARYGGAKRGALVAHEERPLIPQFFAGGPMQTLEFDHGHRLTCDGIASLAFSRSYMPSAESDEGRAARREIDAIFARMSDGDSIVVHYRTVLITGRPAARAVS